MNKIARSTCVNCHTIFPRTEMQQIQITETAGNSIGMSANPSRKRSSRVSGRVYNRNRKVWFCNNCAKAYKSKKIAKTLFWLSVIGVFFLWLVSSKI